MLSSNVAGPGSIDIIYVRNRTQALLVLVQSGPNIMYAAKRRGTIALPMSSIVRRSTENFPHRRVLSTTKASHEIVDIAFATASDSRSNEREE
jgi:hypothetical protein